MIQMMQYVQWISSIPSAWPGTVGITALSGIDLAALLRLPWLRMAVTVLRLSTADAIAEANLAVAGCSTVFTGPSPWSPGASDDSLQCRLVLPAIYVPGVGRRDKLVLRRTEDGCGSDDGSIVGGFFKSEVTSATLLPPTADDSDNPEVTLSHFPAWDGSLERTARHYNDDIHN